MNDPTRLGASEADVAEFIDTISEAGLAETLKVKPVTLRSWRRKGDGPPYYRCGRAVRYKLSEVDQWLSGRRYNSAAHEYSARNNTIPNTANPQENR